jgi:hypothetical protein
MKEFFSSFTQIMSPEEYERKTNDLVNEYEHKLELLQEALLTKDQELQSQVGFINVPFICTLNSHVF